jgi:hypothetical protein
VPDAEPAFLAKRKRRRRRRHQLRRRDCLLRQRDQFVSQPTPARRRSGILAEGQDFSVEAARVDGEHHEAHRYFRATNGGNGTAMAENEIPWWTLSRYGSVRTVIREGLAMMWAEGPGGGHYENMVADYRAVSCGISIANGEVTVTQDFR